MPFLSDGLEPNDKSQKIVYGSGNETSVVVSSLRPYSWYTFQAVAENMAGRSEPGQSFTIRTKGEGKILHLLRHLIQI